MSEKDRVDAVLVSRGLAEDLEQARRAVMAGEVRLNGQPVTKPSRVVSEDAELTVDRGPRYVSRGGEKLAAAFERFPLQVKGLICADVGASTGGFTDCLLQQGAARVYAVDVGYGILDWRLRQDERVVVMERTNARSLKALPEAVHFVTVDVAFISLRKLLPVIKGWFPPAGGQGVCLIKPQFEATRKEAARGAGVITDPGIHRRVLEEVLESGFREGYTFRGLMRSPLKGPKGNREFLAWYEYRPGGVEKADVQPWIDEVC